MRIDTIEDMSVAALASGTHRIKITNVNGITYGELVEREEPDPEVYYLEPARRNGPFAVCATGFRTDSGHEIEVILRRDPDVPLGIQVTVNIPIESGQPVYTHFAPQI